MPKKTKKTQPIKRLPMQKQLEAFPMETAKRLYNDAMKTFGNDKPHETLAKLNVASEIYPLIFGLCLVPRIIIRQGSYMGKHNQADQTELESLIQALLGVNGKVEPNSNIGYKKWIHGQASARAMCERSLDEYMNDIYFYSAVLNLDDAYNKPNPVRQLDTVTRISSRLQRVAKKTSINEGFILFQLSRAQRLLGYYKLEVQSLKESSKLGFAFSECLLGMHELRGYTPKTGKTFIKKDTVSGKLKLERAAKAGIDDAAFALGSIFEKEGDSKSAKDLFTSAAQARHPRAQLKIASTTNKEAQKSRIPSTIRKVTEIKESRQLKKHADSLISIMDEYYKINASEEVNEELLRLSKVPELSLICLYLHQLLHTNFFKDPRPQAFAGSDAKETNISLSDWNQWIVLAGKSTSLAKLGELIKTVHIIIMYYDAIALNKKLRKIEDTHLSLGKLVTQCSQGVVPSLKTITSTLLNIAGKLDDKEHRLLFSESIKNPDAHNVFVLFNTISSLQTATKRTLQAQLFSLGGIIQSLTTFKNPLFHYIAFCYYVTCSATFASTSPMLSAQKSKLGKMHLKKSAKLGLSIAGIIKEEFSTAKTQKSYESAKKRLTALNTLSTHKKTGAPLPIATLQLGKLEETINRLDAAEHYYLQARDAGSTEAHEYLAKLRLRKAEDTLRNEFKSKSGELLTKAELEEKLNLKKEAKHEKIALEKQQKKAQAEAEAATRREELQMQKQIDAFAQQAIEESGRKQKELQDKAKAEDDARKKAIDNHLKAQQAAEKSALRKEKARKQQEELKAKRALARKEKEIEKARKKALRLKQIEREKEILAEKSEKLRLQQEKLEKLKTKPLDAKKDETKPAQAEKKSGRKNYNDQPPMPPQMKQPFSYPPIHTLQPSAFSHNIFDACYSLQGTFAVFQKLFFESEQRFTESRVYFDILSKIMSSSDGIKNLHATLHQLNRHPIALDQLDAVELAWIALTLIYGSRSPNRKVGVQWLDLAYKNSFYSPILTALAIVHHKSQIDPQYVKGLFFQAACPELVGDEINGYSTLYHYFPAHILGLEVQQHHSHRLSLFSPQSTDASSDESNTQSTEADSLLSSDSSRGPSPKSSAAHKK